MYKLPNQTVPESQKTKLWIEETALAFRQEAYANIKSRKKEYQCWLMYHNISNDDEYDYLTKIGDYYLPARIRNISIQRNKINRLSGQQSLRPFNFSAYTCDSYSTKERHKEKIKAYVDRIWENARTKEEQSNVQLQQLELQSQKIQELLQKQPTTEQEAQQLEQLKLSLPSIQANINIIRDKLTNNILLDSEEIKEIERYYKYDKKDFDEEKIQKTLIYLRKKLDIKSKSDSNFISQCVTGKEFYYVDYIPGDKHPTFEVIPEFEVHYPSNSGTEWVQDGKWVMIEKEYTLDDIIKIWDPTDDKINELKQYEQYGYKAKVVYDGFNEKALLEKNLLYSKNSQNGICVSKIFFKSERKVYAKQVPNPYEQGKVFTHFIDDEKKYFNEGQYKFDIKKKKYVDKNTMMEVDKKDIINVNEGEKLQKRYITDIYEVVIAGEKVVLVADKKEITPRTEDEPSETTLPVIGRTFSTLDKQPYSLIWETKDLQKLYKVLTYMKELLIATAGTKGSFMDTSQLPEGMGKEEHRYHRKLGTAYLETVRKSGARVPTGYNQFSNYDDSPSPSILIIDDMLLRIDDMAGNIIGVTRPSQGQIKNTDQVSTFEKSIEQTNIITEMLYKDHDEVQSKAMEILINLGLKYCYKDGFMFEIASSQYGRESVNIPKGLFSDKDITVMIVDNTKEETSIKELKSMAMNQNSKGTISFKDLVSLFSVESLKELEKKTIQIAEESQKLQAEMNNTNTEQQIVIQERIEKLKGEIEMQLKAPEMKLREAELMLKQKELELKGLEIQINANKNEDDKNLQILKDANEGKIESALLQETIRSNKSGEELSQAELELEAIRLGADIGLQGQQMKNDKELKTKEINVKDRSKPPSNKQNISDR